MTDGLAQMVEPSGKSEKELVAEGWTRRFVEGPARLKEMVETYRSLGFEVWLESQAPEELREECHDCMLALALFRVIYTRPAVRAGLETSGGE
jgi:hypothetical protein